MRKSSRSAPNIFDLDDPPQTRRARQLVNRRSHKNEQLSRIQIFEDTDSDGVFDTKKLFHDKITFASGIAIGHGGVYLGAPPNLVFIPDANGDDVPDAEPEVLLDGWGMKDRHETLNSFIWGPDGWLYGCQGVLACSSMCFLCLACQWISKLFANVVQLVLSFGCHSARFKDIP